MFKLAEASVISHVSVNFFPDPFVTSNFLTTEGALSVFEPWIFRIVVACFRNCATFIREMRFFHFLAN